MVNTRWGVSATIVGLAALLVWPASTRAHVPNAAPPCAPALAQGAVCDAANDRALAIMNDGHFEAITVVQDVHTGSLVAFAASEPSTLDVTTPVLPLSVIKLMLAASWWDNRQPDATFENSKGATIWKPVTVHEMIVGGSDSAGRGVAIALRKSVGTKTVVKDFERYGFGRRSISPQDERFWATLAPGWRARLMPASAYASLNDLMDPEWADTLSLGEANITVTALHISRFLQAVGNDGVMIAPTARQLTPPTNIGANRVLNGLRVMQKSTARRLQAAMRDVVQRGTARSIATALADTGWQIGGKTGTGPGLAPVGPQFDGWFAGLIFDPQGKARFTVATFVRHGGAGGGNAARISAGLARYIIGERAP